MTKKEISERLEPLKKVNPFAYACMRRALEDEEDKKKRTYSARRRLENMGQRPRNYNHCPKFL